MSPILRKFQATLDAVCIRHSRFPHIRRTCLSGILLFFFCLLTPVASGFQVQQRDDAVASESLVDENSLFVPGPREILRPFMRAKRALANKEYERAVALIGDVLTESGDEDYLIRLPDEEGVAISLRRSAADLLGSVPKKHRELYELRYGIQAKQLLDKAVAESNFFEMARVMGRFFYTKAGFDAAMLVGYYHLDEGRPLAAAYSFQRVVETAEAREIHDPEVSVLLATCWILADSPDKAKTVLVELKKRQPNQKIRFMNEDVSLFDADENAIPWLKKLIGDTPLAEKRLVSEWAMFRGNPQRNANSGDGFPLFNYRWTVPTLNDIELEKVALENMEQMILSDATTIPSVQPLAINDTIVMRSLDRMVGVDFKTGKRMWTFPPDEDDLFDWRTESPDKSIHQTNRESIRQRMWLDSLFGQSSSDGNSIFFVPQPGTPGYQMQISIDGQRIAHPLSNRQFNELHAINVARQGAFKWEVGGKTGLSEPKLAEAFFLGAPLPLDGVLYAIVQQKGEIVLVALDAETGKLQWRRNLASGEKDAGAVVNQRERRLAGATPSFSDGILVCPCGMGAIVAVDIATRTLIWGFQYGSSRYTAEAPRIEINGTSASKIVNPFWLDSSVTISDGCVLYAPVDTNNLITLDLLDGRPLWRNGKGRVPWIQREDSRLVAAVEDQKALLVGVDFIRAIDLKSGKEAWRINTGEYGRPSGYGYLNHGHYYLPLSSEQILKVDVRRGEIVEAVRTNGVLGNLICYRGEVISHGVAHLSVFPQDGPNRRMIESVEKQGELSSDQLAIKAQIFLQGREYLNAAKSISTAYEQDQNSRHARVLAEAIVGLLNVDFKTGMEFWKNYSNAIPNSDRQRVDAARISGLIEAGEHQDAFGLVVENLIGICRDDQANGFLVELRSLFYEGPKDASKELAQRTTIRYERWLASRMRYLFSNAEKEQADEWRSKLAEVVEKNRDLTMAERFRLLSNFGFENVSEEVKLEFAGHLEKFNEYLRANIVKSNGRIRPEAEIDEMLRTEMSRNRRAPEVGSWKTGSVKADILPPSDDSYSQLRTTTRNVIDVVESDNPLFDELLFRYYSVTQVLEIIDRDGVALARFSAREEGKASRTTTTSTYIRGKARIHGYLMSVKVGTVAFTFDLVKALKGEEPELWYFDQSQVQYVGSLRRHTHRNLWGATVSSTTGSLEDLVRVSSPSANGLCYMEKSALVCVDPLSGRKLWTRFGFRRELELLVDLETVTTWDSKQRIANTYSLFSGEWLGAIEIPDSIGSIWAIDGRQVLVSEATKYLNPDYDPAVEDIPEFDVPEDAEPKFKTRKSLVSMDAVTGEILWRRDYRKKVCASLVKNRQIVVLDESGDVEFLDFRSGESVAQHKTNLPPKQLKRLLTIDARELEHGLLLMVHCHKSTSYRHTNSVGQSLTGSRYQNFWNGYALVFSSDRKDMKYGGPMKVQYFNVASNLPYSSPLILLNRRVDRQKAVGSQRYWTQVVAIDLRSGRTAANVKTQYSSSYDYRIENDLAAQQVFFHFRDKSIRFQLTDESPPPGPIAHLTNTNAAIFKLPGKPLTRDLVSIKPEAKQKLLDKIKAQQKRLEAKQIEMQKLMEKQRGSK